MQKRLIILDRDGVINEDSDAYIKSPEEWIPIPGSIEAIALLSQHYHIGIATNQSGVGRGYYNEATLHAMHDKMHTLLAPHNGNIDHIEFCPHKPDECCDCRKPKAGMLNKLAEKFAAKPEDVVMVGDTMGDYQAATNAGMSFVLVKTGKGERTIASGNLPEHIMIYDDLAAYTNTLSLNSQETET